MSIGVSTGVNFPMLYPFPLCDSTNSEAYERFSRKSQALLASGLRLKGCRRQGGSMLPFAPDAASPKPAKNYIPSKGPPAEPSGPLYLPLNLDYPGLRKVHNSPPIYVCDDFLTHEECDAFITTAGPLLQRSKTHAIAGNGLPSSKPHLGVRPSVTCFSHP